MKKLLFSGSLVAGVLTLVSGLTVALFSAQGQILGNTVSTGTLQLTLNKSAGKPFSVTNAFPGYVSPTWEYADLYNTGTLPFEALMSFQYSGGDGALFNELTIWLTTAGGDGICGTNDFSEVTIWNGKINAYPTSTVVSLVNFWHNANEGDGSGSPADNIRPGWTERICQKVGVASTASNSVMGQTATFTETVDAVQDND